MTWWQELLNLLITGCSNGLVVALVALGYTMVYGIIELINFAHGDVVMLGCFLTLTLIGLCGFAPPADGSVPWLALMVLLVVVPMFGAGLNWGIERIAYRPVRGGPKLNVLVTAIGMSFILVNLGLFWGALPMEVFAQGHAAASPKDVPDLLGYRNVLGEHTVIELRTKDLLVLVVTLPLMIALTWFIQRTRLGTAMRATAQDPTAASLMGIDVDRVIGLTFAIGGALAGVAAVVKCLVDNSFTFQSGYRLGLDAFTAAVLGGIGNLPGAVLGGLAIGLLRAGSDFYLSSIWTNALVFAVLIAVLLFRPSGLLGARIREKV